MVAGIDLKEMAESKSCGISGRKEARRESSN